MFSFVRRSFAWGVLVAVPAIFGSGSAADVRAAEPGSGPELRSLDSHFPFTVPADRKAWEEEAERTRRQIRVSLGLWPMPELAPPEPQRYGRVQGEGFTVERITFVSLPTEASAGGEGEGLVVTGSLYRPDPLPEHPMPGVLCPHGHWANGRFYDAGEAAAKQQIAIGAERFLPAARNPIQARCVQLARMGCTVLQWDMLGYADSGQISYERAHRFAQQDAATEQTDEGWLLYSPRAEAELQSVMGLQTINAIAAFRVLRGLEGVDAERIAVTGASGGGTQTFILAAIEPEIAAAFPAVMVSTGMQGGCTCENASLLRIDGGNVKIAACIAPRPLGLTAADDWTARMAEDGFPELRELYAMFGAQERVELTPLVHFGHNYNHVSRTAMYGWINRVFELGHEQPVLESPFTRLLPEDLTVWDAEHPQPAGGESFERALLKQWAAATEAQLRQTVASADADRAAGFDSIVRPAVEALVGPPTWGEGLRFEAASEDAPEASAASPGVVRGNLTGASLEGAIPLAIGGGQERVKRVVIVLHPEGREGMQQDASVWQAVDQGPGGATAILGATLAGQGSRRAMLSSEGQQRLVREDRLAAAYTYGYNRPLVAQQAREILAIAQWCREAPLEAEQVEVVATGAAGLAGALAGAVAGELIDACAVEADAFRFADVGSIRDPQFLPGGGRYFDLPGMLALHSPRPLVIGGETAESAFPVAEIYNAKEAEGSLDLASRKAVGAAALVERLRAVVTKSEGR